MDQQARERTPTLRNRPQRQLPNFMYGATYPKPGVPTGSPTYFGALEWLKDHKPYIDKMVDLLQSYPNLIKEPCMDRFWDYTQPLVYNNELLLRYDDFLTHQFGFQDQFHLGGTLSRDVPTAASFFKGEQQTIMSEYTYPVHRALACFPSDAPLPGTVPTYSPSREESAQGMIKQIVLEALHPFLHVRTNCAAEFTESVKPLDICRSVCGGILLFFLCGATMEDPVCQHLLRLALAYGSPVVFLREPGYQLPQDLPDDLVTPVKEPVKSPFKPRSNGMFERKREFPGSAVGQDQPKPDISVNDQSDSSSTPEPSSSDAPRSVAKALQDGYSQSVVFNLKLVSPSIMALYEAINKHCPIPFPKRPSPALFQKPSDKFTAAFPLPRMENHSTGVDTLLAATKAGEPKMSGMPPNRPRSAATMSYGKPRISRIGSARTTRPFSAAATTDLHIQPIKPFNAFMAGQTQ